MKLTEKNLLITNGAIVTMEVVEIAEHDYAPVSQWAFCSPLTPELIAKQREGLERKLEAAATLTDSEIPEGVTEALSQIEEKIAAEHGDDAKVGFGQPFEICWN